MSAAEPVACLFCDVVAGTEAASRVYEDDDVLAFMDLYPVNPGHTLVIPKRHATGLGDLDVDLGAALWRVAHRLGVALGRTGLRCEGVNLFLADGAAAFQTVFHVHLHVFPRFAGDAFGLVLDVHEQPRADLDATAALLTSALAGGTARGRDLVDDLRRWEDSGAVWEVVHRGAGTVTVALLRCDGGEEVERFTTSDPRTLAFIGDRDGGPRFG